MSCDIATRAISLQYAILLPFSPSSLLIRSFSPPSFLDRSYLYTTSYLFLFPSIPPSPPVITYFSTYLSRPLLSLLTPPLLSPLTPPLLSASFVGLQLMASTDDGYVVSWTANTLRAKGESAYRRTHAQMKALSNAESKFNDEWGRGRCSSETRYAFIRYVLLCLTTSI